MDRAVTQVIDHLHNELGAQSQHNQEIFLLEDGLLQATNVMHNHDDGLHFLQDKIEDLENLFQLEQPSYNRPAWVN